LLLSFKIGILEGGDKMIQINVKELLKKQKKTKYWFVKQMEGGYQSLTRMMENQTSGIRFDTLEKMCDIFDCEIGDIIVRKKGKKKNE
jgi:putative transcriptional regulator